jgi:aminoglycoside phosphotransferase (APT) family kinase protein
VARDLASELAPAELEALWTCFNENPTSEFAPCLAHGDFDVTPSFYCHDGRYSGLIDFGKIRGTEPTFDLGHFLLHDMETAPWPLLEDILDGYAAMNPGPAENRAAIRRSALQLGTRQLARRFKRFGPQQAPRLPLVQGRVQRLRGLSAA